MGPGVDLVRLDFAITIPTGDVFFDPFNTGTQTIPFRRASSISTLAAPVRGSGTLLTLLFTYIPLASRWEDEKGEMVPYSPTIHAGLRKSRIRLFCDSYGIAVSSAVMDAVIARLQTLADFITGKARQMDSSYVKMLDEREGEVAPHELARAFNRKPVWQRMAIVVAGPAFNLLLAVILYFMLFTHGVDGTRAVLGEIPAKTPAAEAQLQKGEPVRDLCPHDGQAVFFRIDERGSRRALQGEPVETCDLNVLGAAALHQQRGRGLLVELRQILAVLGGELLRLQGLLHLAQALAERNRAQPE